MPNPLYQKLGGGMPNSSLLKNLLQFKNGFSGNPQQIVQNMLNTGKISQAQLNQCAQQANQIYSQFKDFM